VRRNNAYGFFSATCSFLLVSQSVSQAGGSFLRFKLERYKTIACMAR
jgi:hypothetical protein